MSRQRAYTLDELVAHAELADIRYLEKSGRVDPSADPTKDADPELTVNNGIGIPVKPSGIVAFMDATYSHPLFRLYVKAGAFYRLPDEPHEPLAEELLADFGYRVAEFHLWPFLRSGLSTLGAELGLHVPPLGLNRAPVDAGETPHPPVDDA